MAATLGSIEGKSADPQLEVDRFVLESRVMSLDALIARHQELFGSAGMSKERSGNSFARIHPRGIIHQATMWVPTKSGFSFDRRSLEG